MTPRWYQRIAISSGVCTLSEQQSTIIAIGCGGGKSVIGSKLIEEWLPGRTLWLGDQNELVFAPLRIISRIAGVIPGLEKSGKKASHLAKVVVGSAQTLCRKKRREAWPRDHFDFILVDEAHRASEQKAEITNHFETAKVLGLTATPFKRDLRDLSEWYESICFAMPLFDPNGENGLIQQGFAPPMKHLVLPIEIDLKNVELKKAVGETEEDYDLAQLDTTIQPYYEEICRQLAEKCKGYKIIVFHPLIKSSKAFVAIAQKHGFVAKHVDGHSEDREETLEHFAAGNIEILSNAGVISTGVDLPIASAFLNLKPTRSRVQYFQSLGRVSRTLPGVIDHLPEKNEAEERKAHIAQSPKPHFLVIDVLYMHDEMCMHAGHLVAQSDKEARDIFDRSKKERSPQELADIAKWLQAQKEKAVAERINFAAHEIKTKVFSPELMGMLTGDDSIMSYDPSQRWELQPPNPSQLERLHKWGVDCSQVTTFGLAHALIGRFMNRFERRLATLPQLRAMYNLGLKGYEDFTLEEASRILDAAKRRRTA